MVKVQIKKRGKYFQYTFEIAPQDGKRKWITKSGFKSKPEAERADIKAVSKRLGHSTVEFTYNIYVRVTTKMEEEIVSKFESYLAA